MAHCWGAAGKVLLEMEGRGVLQNLIANVGQLEIVYIPVKGWIIDPDVHGYFDGTSDIVHLPTLYGEIVYTECNDQRCYHGHRWRREALRCSLNLSPKVIVKLPMYSSSQSSWSHLKL